MVSRRCKEQSGVVNKTERRTDGGKEGAEDEDDGTVGMMPLGLQVHLTKVVWPAHALMDDDGE